MADRGTLRLDSGREVRVEVAKTKRDGDEMLVRAIPDPPPAPTADLLTIIDAHLATAAPHAAGTTDRLLAADRDRQNTRTSRLPVKRQHNAVAKATVRSRTLRRSAIAPCRQTAS